jgi:hypothetical protein
MAALSSLLIEGAPEYKQGTEFAGPLAQLPLRKSADPADGLQDYWNWAGVVQLSGMVFSIR